MTEKKKAKGLERCEGCDRLLSHTHAFDKYFGQDEDEVFNHPCKYRHYPEQNIARATLKLRFEQNRTLERIADALEIIADRGGSRRIP